MSSYGIKHVLMLLVSCKSSSKCRLARLAAQRMSAAIHETGGRHMHDGLIDGTLVSACDHADAAPNPRLDTPYRDLAKPEGSPGTPEDDVNMDLFQAKLL
jgi:hypothetical protein